MEYPSLLRRSPERSYDAPIALKKYGQHYLVNGSMADRIVKNVPASELRNILEIGPGSGVLTERLLMRGARVRAIEVDDRLVPYLKERFRDRPVEELKIIEGDARYLLAEELKKRTYLVTNLPFNISSDILGIILDNSPFIPRRKNMFKGSTMMLQREFARRLISPKGSKEYGKLSVSFQSRMEYLEMMNVPRHFFSPQPNVDAAVIDFRPKEHYPSPPENVSLFMAVLTVSFLNRRKMLKNSLNPRSLNLGCSPEELHSLLAKNDIGERRPEELGPDEFIALSNRIWSELKG